LSHKNVTTLNSWHEIDWQKVNASVKNLRHRIFVASREGDDKTVKNLQKLMLRSTKTGWIMMKTYTFII
jgi:RNA-directed DNA polymerase